MWQEEVMLTPVIELTMKIMKTVMSNPVQKVAAVTPPYTIEMVAGITLEKTTDSQEMGTQKSDF